jgi:hypothetical protein
MSPGDGDALAIPLRRFVDGMEGVPAVLLDRHLDVIAASPLALAIHPGLSAGANMVSLGVLAADRSAAEAAAAAHSELAALLRDAVARSATDDRFVALIGELVATNRGFSTAWAESRPGRSRGHVQVQHALGPLRLEYVRLPIEGADGTALVLARPSEEATGDRLRRLGKAVDRTLD